LEKLIEQHIEKILFEKAILIKVATPMLKTALQKKCAQKNICSKKIFINPPGVDSYRFRPEISNQTMRRALGEPPNRIIIGTRSHFTPKSGIHRVVQALGHLLRSHPDYRDRVKLWIIGDGREKAKVRRTAYLAGATQHITFIDEIPYEQTPTYLAACDLFVLPTETSADDISLASIEELFEYMAMGRAIIASDLPSIRDHITHEKNGWLTPPFDMEALAHALQIIIDTPLFCKALGEAAREEVLQHHTWEKHHQRLLERLNTDLTDQT
ncbi:glycosyltransferase family 4 protein, partial [Magnetococcales bacterium HHB-1]